MKISADIRYRSGYFYEKSVEAYSERCFYKNILESIKKIYFDASISTNFLIE